MLCCLLSMPSSDFDRVLGEYTKEGFRVLALASGPLPTSIPDTQLPGLTQEELEAATPLTLVGLAVMANPLRPDSAGVITQLHKANIRCAMVTGDHVRTAISVAHQAGILPEGKAVCLVDGADASSTGPVFPLSVLYPDGSVMANVQKSVVMPQVGQAARPGSGQLRFSCLALRHRCMNSVYAFMPAAPSYGIDLEVHE